MEQVTRTFIYDQGKWVFKGHFTLHTFLIGCKTINWYEIINKSTPCPCHLTHHFQSSYEYPIQCQSEDSMSWQMIICIPQLCWLLHLEWLTNCEHIVHCFQHMSFWRSFLDSHPTIHHSNIGVQFKVRNRMRHIYLKSSLGPHLCEWEHLLLYLYDAPNLN